MESWITIAWILEAFENAKKHIPEYKIKPIVLLDIGSKKKFENLFSSPIPVELRADYINSIFWVEVKIHDLSEARIFIGLIQEYLRKGYTHIYVYNKNLTLYTKEFPC